MEKSIVQKRAEHVTELKDMIGKPSLLKKILPFLPIVFWNKELRLFTLLLWDNSYCVYPVGKTHFFEWNKPNYRKWFQPPICGFNLWL